MVERTTRKKAGGKETADKLSEIEKGHAGVEKIVSRSREGAKPARRGGKKISKKLSECDQLIDLVPVLMCDLDGRIILWTGEDEKLYGYTRSEAIGQVSHELFKTVFPVSGEDVDRSLQEKGSWQGELIYTSRDGRRITVASHQVLYHEDGKPVAIMEVDQDVTGLKQADDALSRLTSLIDLSPDAIIVRRLDGTITYWSHGAESLYGWKKDEALGKQTHALFQTRFPEPLEKINGQLARTGRWSGELVHTTRDGRQITVQSWWLSRGARPGQIDEILESNIDTTELRRTQLLAEQTTKLQEQARIIDLAHAIIRDPDSRIITWTSGDELLYGYSKKEAIGRTSHELFGTIFPISREEVDKSLKLTGHWQGELVHTAKDGHKVFVASHQVLYREHGKPVAILEVNNDISERKRTEEILKESEASLAKAQQIAHIGNWSWDLKDDKIVCSDELFRIFGLDKQDHMAYGQFLDMLQRDDRERVNRAIEAAIHHQQPYSIDYRIVTPDRSERIIHADGEVIYSRAGKPQRFFGTVQDVTSKRQADRTMAEYTTKLQEQARIIDLAHVMIRDMHSRIALWTSGDEILYGYSKEEAIGKVTHDLFKTVFPVSKEAVDESLEKTGRWQGELTHTAKDGHKVIVASHQVLYREQGKPVAILEVNNDITERKQADEVLRRQAALIDLSPDGIFVRKHDGTITFWSHGAESLYGWSKKEAIGKKAFDLLKKVFPQPMEEINQQLLKTGFWSGEVVETTKDGRKIIVQSRWMAERNGKGHIQELMESNVDITGRKQTENRLREARNQAELYLDIMGHDINNLNQVALTNLDLIKDDENLTVDQREALTDSLNSVKGSAAIIDNVRKIQAITQEKLAMQPEDLDEMIRGCIAEAPRPSEYAVTINYTPRKGCMIMGTALMKEVFCNLINNSIKHAGRDVTIDVRLDETRWAGKKFYEVSIADNGPGIPDELKPKLFARFQRGDTKAHGKGLGLFIVKSLVETSGGNVTVEDRVPGDYTQGAKFIVSLPASEGYR